MIPTPSPPPGRRTVLRALLAAAGSATLAACTRDGDDPPGVGHSGSTSAATVSAAPSRAPLTPDEHLLEDASSTIATASTQLAGAAREHRSLRPLLRPAVAAHREHSRLLMAAGRHRGTFASLVTKPVPDDVRAALAYALDAERVAARSLGRAVMHTESGALARALASVAASCTQRSAVLAVALDELPRSQGRRRHR